MAGTDTSLGAQLRHVLGSLVRHRGRGPVAGGPVEPLLHHVEALLAGRERPVVGVFEPPEGRLADRVSAACPVATVVTLRPGRRIVDLHAQLAPRRRLDLIVDDTRSPRRRVQLFRSFFWHLAEGGSYVFRAPARGSGRDANEDPSSRDVATVLADLLARAAGAGDVAATPAFDGVRLARAMGPLTRGRGYLSVSNTGRARLKLREEDLRGVLAGRPELGRILRALPATRFASRCTLRLAPGTSRQNMPPVFDVPELSVREYRDVIVTPEQLVLTDDLILPDSFRHNQKDRLRSAALDEVAPRFAQPDVPVTDPPVLPGWYYHVDNEHPWHFGHVMTEQLSRLWGWREAKQAHPELKAIIGVYVGRHGGREMAPWQFELLEAAGVDRSDVVVIREPTRVEHLVSAAPLLSMPDYVHPDIARTWRSVGDALAATAPAAATPRRIFVSRRGGVRRCHNVAAVEQLFADHGFEVVLPAELSLPAQVALFRGADVIGGFAGAGLFHTIWCTGPRRVIALTHEAYTARNEYMIASVLGHEHDLVVSKPDIPQPPGGWTMKSFRSPFTFDMAHEGRYLRDLLSDLS